MTKQPSSATIGKALGIGVINSLLLSAIMVPLSLTGVSPMPQPVGLAFAETLLGRMLPLPVGLLFHVIYVTFWSALFGLYVQPRNLRRALLLGFILWIVVLLVFFPIIGWGFFGLGISPALIPASLLPHLLFGFFLWGLCRMMLIDSGE